MSTDLDAGSARETTLPPQDQDRIEALRFALERIARAAATNQDWDTQRTALYALAEDKHAEQAQDAANEADMRRESIHTEACSICGGPCILDPHFACAIAEAQR